MNWNDLTPWAFVRGSFFFVDFFFVLSGFVMAHTYGTRLNSGAACAAFTVRRFGRLWPLHAFILALFFGVECGRMWLSHTAARGNYAPFTGQMSWSGLAASLGLVQALNNFDWFAWNIPSWSISVEFWAYVVFAIIAVLPRWRRNALALVVMALSAWHLHLHVQSLDLATYQYGFSRCILGFFCGVVLYDARLLLGSRLAARLNKWKETTTNRLGSVLEYSAIVGAFLFISLCWNGAWSLAAPIVFAVIVLIFSYELGAVSRFLRRPVFQELGNRSYSIYLGHYLLIHLCNILHAGLVRFGSRHAAIHKALQFSSPAWFWGASILVLAASVVSARVTFLKIEEPCRRFFNRMAQWPIFYSLTLTTPGLKQSEKPQ